MEQINMLNAGERFVIAFPRGLISGDNIRQIKIHMDDLMEAKVAFGNGMHLPWFYVLDLSGDDFPVTAEGVSLAEYVAWVAGVYCRQFAGVTKLTPFGHIPWGDVSALLESTDSPDYWLLSTGLVTCLLVFDPFSVAYRELATWMDDFDPTAPKNIDEAVTLLRDTSYFELIDAYRKADSGRRASMIGYLLDSLCV